MITASTSLAPARTINTYPASGATRLRLRFFRTLLTPLEQALGPALTERLQHRLPNRLRPWLDAERLRSCGPMDAIELELAEDLLESLEQALGDKSGHLLEAAAYDIFSHALGEQRIHGDETPIATVARLRPIFERLVFGVAPGFDLSRMPSGFMVLLVLPGHRRMAEPLRKLGVGAIRAALHANAARTGQRHAPVLRSGVDGDRAWILASSVHDPNLDGSVLQPL